MSTQINWPDGKCAALTISFDDGYADTYQETSKWLAERGLAATYFIVSRLVGKHFEKIPTATWENWRLSAAQGHEVASHSATHASVVGPRSAIGSIFGGILAAPDRAVQLRQLILRIHALRKYPKSDGNGHGKIDPLLEPQVSLQEIQQQLPEYKVLSYSYPAGRFNTAVRRAVIDSGYRSARGNQAGINKGSSSIFGLRSLCLGPGLALPELEPWFFRTIDQGGWLIITFHLVSKDNPTQYPYHCSDVDFQCIVKRIEELPFWVATQQAVVDFLGSGQPL